MPRQYNSYNVTKWENPVLLITWSFLVNFPIAFTGMYTSGKRMPRQAVWIWDGVNCKYHRLISYMSICLVGWPTGWAKWEINRELIVKALTDFSLEPKLISVEDCLASICNLSNVPIMTNNCASSEKVKKWARVWYLTYACRRYERHLTEGACT